MKKINALIILDGFGCGRDCGGNAISVCGIPNVKSYLKRYPNTKIKASGLAVGLPDGQMGNSEVGHLNIGAGSIVPQELLRITNAVNDGSFFDNAELVGVMEHCRERNSSLHLMGLCSDGGVHSHISHLYALVRLAKKTGLEKVYIHCFMDGRDVSPESGHGYIMMLQKQLEAIGCGKIATVGGRYYAMDRDKNYGRVEKAYAAMVYGEGVYFEDAAAAVQASYDSGVTDEFIVPVVITENGAPVGTVENGDGMVFFNFRPDRAREITAAFTLDDFTGFERRGGRPDVKYVGFTSYSEAFDGKLGIAFDKEVLNGTFGEYISDMGLRQLRIAETEKFAHVTSFFSGGREEEFPGEDRVLIPSPAVATYDLKPEMSAYEVKDEAVRRIHSGEYDVMILNFANPDMVGHTGVRDAAVKAVQTVDECVKEVVDAVIECGGRAIITADHGNCEEMVNEATGKPHTAHTTSLVPFILVDEELLSVKLRDDGSLCDIAPTLLEMMGLEKNGAMTGRSLILKS